jgi:hypothetical protein
MRSARARLEWIDNKLIYKLASERFVSRLLDSTAY